MSRFRGANNDRGAIVHNPLQPCISSPSATEIIVVDDGSRDACISRTVLEFPDIQVIRNPRPRGFAIAANRGIALATGQIIELLNDDTQVTAGWAEVAIRHFADPTVAAVAPLVLQGPRGDTTPIIDSAGDDYDLGGFARKRGHGQPFSESFASPCEVSAPALRARFTVPTCFVESAGFPEDFGAYFEDVDLSWRIRQAGFRAMYEPGSVVWHRVGSSYQKSELLSNSSRETKSESSGETCRMSGKRCHVTPSCWLARPCAGCTKEHSFPGRLEGCEHFPNCHRSTIGPHARARPDSSILHDLIAEWAALVFRSCGVYFLAAHSAILQSSPRPLSGLAGTAHAGTTFGADRRPEHLARQAHPARWAGTGNATFN